MSPSPPLQYGGQFMSVGQLQPTFDWSQYKIGPQNDDYTNRRIAAGQNQVGISAQPTFSERVIKAIFGTSTQNASTGLGFGPIELEAPLAGIVLSPENVNLIKQKLAALPLTDNLSIARKFMQTKYPKLMSIINLISDWTEPKALTVAGDFSQQTVDKLPSGGAVRGLPVGDINTYNANTNWNIDSVVNTLGHEATHARQFQQDTNVFKNYISSDKNLDQYFAQPTEVQARQGGGTAQGSFNSFIQKAFPKYDMNKHVRESTDFIDAVVRPTWEDRQRYIDTFKNKPIIMQRLQFSLDSDKELLIRHLDPTYDAIANNKNPLTAGMLLQSLNLNEFPISKNQHLEKFLLDNGYGGITTSLYPDNKTIIQKGYVIPTPKLIKNLVGRQ